MQTPSAAAKVSSLETITNSIRYDAQVYRWFALLIEHRAVRDKLSRASLRLNGHYLALNRSAVIQWLHGITGILILAAIRENREYLYALLLPFVLYGLVRSFARRRDLVAQLSRELLSRDFPDGALETKTLYQLAEIYSRTYAIPSLVDTIFHWDRILQAAVLLGLFVSTVVFPSKIWECSLFLLLALALATALIRSKILYRRLR